MRGVLRAAGITVIAAEGNRESLDLLLKLYKEIDWDIVRKELFRAIEPLAGRVGVVIKRNGEQIQVK